MDISLLHIGMMKTASSYMQNLWMRHPEICISQKGSFNLMNVLREGVLRGEVKADSKFDIETDVPWREGQKIVLSNEGFSTAYFNGTLEEQEKVGVYIDYARSMLRQLLPGLENILIVVREPVSWIRSMYIQSIKEGGVGTLQEYVDRNELFLCHSLNLRQVFTAYAEVFSNVLVLPYELLKTDELGYWKRLEKTFGLPVPEKLGGSLNVSPSYADTALLERLNRSSRLIHQALDGSSSYQIPQEKGPLLEGYGSTALWVNRRFVEYATEAEKAALRSAYDLEESQDQQFEFSLPSKLAESTAENYSGFLTEKRLIPDAYDSLYQLPQLVEKRVGAGEEFA